MDEIIFRMKDIEKAPRVLRNVQKEACIAISNSF